MMRISEEGKRVKREAGTGSASLDAVCLKFVAATFAISAQLS